MLDGRRAAPRRTPVVALLCALLMGPGSASAATFIDRLEAAHGLIAEQRYREARALLDGEVAPRAREPAQQALLLAAQGTTEAALKHDAEAMALVQRALELKQHLPEASGHRLRFLLGQLQLRAGHYAAAGESLEAWFRATGRSTPEAHWLLASAYLMQDRLDAGLAQIKKGRGAGGEPPEDLQRLLLAALQRAGRLKEAAAWLERRLERAPDHADDWLRLAALQRELGAEDQALGILQTLHRRGELTRESEFLALADLQLRRGVPYRAAKLLEGALQDGQIAPTDANWLMLIRAWQKAREIAKARAVAARASRDRQDPQFTLLEAQFALQLGDWAAASSAADRLLARPAAEDPGGAAAHRAAAHAVRGIALARQGHLHRARAALAIAVEDPRQAAQARPWLDYVEQTIGRPGQGDG